MSGGLGDGWGSGWDSGETTDWSDFDWNQTGSTDGTADGSGWWDNIGGGLDSVDGTEKSGGGIMDWIKGIGAIMGGGDAGGSGGSIWEGLLAGLGGAADSFISKETVEEQGKQSRKTLDFKAALEDHYMQKDKVRKRAALDTYGQFSLTSKFAPNMVAAPPVELPAKPGV